jgi:uncharacterized membrane protein YdjX (TVP38/TMEM64 family)
MTTTETLPLPPSLKWLRIRLLVLLAIVIILALIFLPVKEYLFDLTEWIHSLGYWGMGVFILTYIILTMLMIPGAPLTLTAGMLFGIPLGVLCVSAGTTLGATGAFLVSRYFARRQIARRLANSPRFQALDRAVGREGFKIVFLTRLSPIFPFKILNYTYGLTSVRVRDYIIGSWTGMLPGAIVYVSLGKTSGSLLEALRKGGPDAAKVIALQLLAVIATIVATVLITRIARRALKETMPEVSIEEVTEP